MQAPANKTVVTPFQKLWS